MLKLGLKGKFGMALASTALGAALIGGGTFALFTDTATNNNNTFTAGKLDISDFPDNGVFTQTVNFANLAPGDSENATLTITNNGTLDAWVRVDPNGTTTTGDLFSGDNKLQLNLDQNVYFVAANGGQATLTVGYEFPKAAGNEYQGKRGTATFKVQAVQVRNNTTDSNGNGDLSDEAGPDSWN
jgi:spore coat-associated protein N